MIDYRHHYILVLDTETANTIQLENGRLDMSSTLVYDVGWRIMDTKGHIYRERSYINSDIFIHENDLMQSAYYAHKIPKYKEDIAQGKRILANTYTIHNIMMIDMREFKVKEVCAHNARFDLNALNNIERWTTKSKWRYWFPYGTIWWDSMRMAQSVIGKKPTYRKFCEEHGYLTKTGKLSMTAENLYRFITKNPDFKESHTGLEDVQIESQIILYCYRQKKAMKKLLFEEKKNDV